MLILPSIVQILRGAAPDMHCWKVLKDKPKWLQRNKHTSNVIRKGKKQRTTSDGSPSAATLGVVGGKGDDGEPSGGALERPPGKKKDLQRIRQRASIEAVKILGATRKEADAEKEKVKEETCKKTFALQEERIKIEKERINTEKERVEFKKKLEEERIMNIDMSSLSYKQRQFYEMWQEEILAKRGN